MPLKRKGNSSSWGLWGLGFLMAHELDAVYCQEWRMLPFFNFLNDHYGYQAFTLLHAPIFTAILWSIRSNSHGKYLYRWSIFNIVHTGLHIIALACPLNQFTSPLSWCLILGGGICGIMDILYSI